MPLREHALADPKLLWDEFSEPGNWKQASVGQLIERLESDHHSWRTQALPFLDALLEKRARREKSDSIFALRRIFHRLCDELEAHLHNEETVLFPAMVALDRAARLGEPRPKLAFGSVQNPISMIQRDHDEDHVRWDTVRHLALLDAVAAGASPEARGFYQDLTLFENAVQSHTWVENNLLFPLAVQLERQAATPC